MNEPLAQIFRYNRWANARLIEACRPLTDAQLDAEPGGGTFGTIRATLIHMTEGQRDCLARLEGRSQASGVRGRWAGFDALTDLANTTSDALINAAEALVDDQEIVVPFMGKRPAFPKSFFLAHAAVHGIEHRTQIGVMLVRLGVPPPDLDGWPYAEAAGYGKEAPAP